MFTPCCDTQTQTPNGTATGFTREWTCPHCATTYTVSGSRKVPGQSGTFSRTLTFSK